MFFFPTSEANKMKKNLTDISNYFKKIWGKIIRRFNIVYVYIMNNIHLFIHFFPKVREVS